MMRIPRILLASASSGAGKTMITCGLLKCLKDRGLCVTPFKCGPDYIDSMFHKETLKMDSYNLDTFLCGRQGVRDILLRHGQGDIAVIEGVMGYYDGIAGISCEASAYDAADASDTPVVLIVDCKGASLSILPCIQGFLHFKEKEAKNSHIAGVILNRMSPMLYERMKTLIETEAGTKVYGYVPAIKDMNFKSRHLGLKMPGEIEDFQEEIGRLAGILAGTLDIDGLVELAGSAPELAGDIRVSVKTENHRIRVGLARDEAFCFMYQDNLDMLEEMGASLVPFSPLHDRELPEGLDGLLLYGGYPELYAKELDSNARMRRAVKEAIEGGLPCMAECGGFMYLKEELEDETGAVYKMAGAIPGKSYRTSSLRRFGYLTLEGGAVFGQTVGAIPAHEFHYYDSDECGRAFLAKKPLSERNWECMISTETLFAGYPHIHYAGNREVAKAFLHACERRAG